ncbi:Hpt domain-containing protein [Luteimonas sp. MC1572]|uniref:Hpt domain-containing protein n=1 Tax=Luteimonas sp. MC1572 TaxID=2799325 RepID=UPI0018F07747|nr:Hpt domain-containing protein [Luteimonas sp. MC1572]MBJ6980369.1 Hpt domain-containing protein [Luteimonas sp. MC1572]QQO04252.1 Hpt domain-containing protein [Luteimonas sp. MC1572]
MPFDVRVLRDISGDEPQAMVELVECFDEVATGMRAGLLQAAADGDAGQAAMLAHSLKSSSRALGAMVLGELCAELEAYGGAGRLARIKPAVTAVVGELDAALAAMRHWRAAQPPASPWQGRSNA